MADLSVQHNNRFSIKADSTIISFQSDKAYFGSGGKKQTNPEFLAIQAEKIAGWHNSSIKPNFERMRPEHGQNYSRKNRGYS